MKLHKESKGTIIVASIVFAVIAFISIYFLEALSLLIIIPLLIIYGLVFWFFRVPNRNILEHSENVIAPVDGKVVMIKEVFEDEFVEEPIEDEEEIQQDNLEEEIIEETSFLEFLKWFASTYWWLLWLLTALIALVFFIKSFAFEIN